MNGKKFDGDKIMFDLIDPTFVEGLAKVLTMGAAKYEPNNWQYVENGYNRYMGALHRHINKYQQGEENDQESGLSHLYHATCNLMFLASEDLINGRANLQADECDDSSRDTESERDDEDGVCNDNVYGLRKSEIEELCKFVRIFDQVGSHFGSGTYYIDSPSEGRFSVILSSDNETQDYVANLEFATLSKLFRLSDSDE